MTEPTNPPTLIGIDLDERNAELARDRVGPMFLQVREDQP